MPPRKRKSTGAAAAEDAASAAVEEPSAVQMNEETESPKSRGSRRASAKVRQDEASDADQTPTEPTTPSRARGDSKRTAKSSTAEASPEKDADTPAKTSPPSKRGRKASVSDTPTAKTATPKRGRKTVEEEPPAEEAAEASPAKVSPPSKRGRRAAAADEAAETKKAVEQPADSNEIDTDVASRAQQAALKELGSARGKGGHHAQRPVHQPTVQQIEMDVLTRLAHSTWAAGPGKFDPEIVERIFYKELQASRFSYTRIMLLEFSQYLEKYLWPHFDAASASVAHVLSIVLMVNEKMRERVSAWNTFANEPRAFPGFFHRVLVESLNESHSVAVRTALLVFLINAFQSLEVAIVRQECLQLVSLLSWEALLPSRREAAFQAHPHIGKAFRALQKHMSKQPAERQQRNELERSFTSKFMQLFMRTLDAIPPEGDEVDLALVRYCDRCLELLIDLENQLPTRRFFNTLMDDHQVLVAARTSALFSRPEGALFRELYAQLSHYAAYEINDYTGEAMSAVDVAKRHAEEIGRLQQAAFERFGERLRDFAMGAISAVDSPEALSRNLGVLADAELTELCAALSLRTASLSGAPRGRSFLLEALVDKYRGRPSHLDDAAAMPLYPTEQVLWGVTAVDTEHYSGDHCLALPKLNMQFLSLQDYLARNFHLFRLEANYDVRIDLEDAVQRLSPRATHDEKTEFGGWARMAVPVANFAVTQLGKADLGESRPSRVVAEVVYSLARYSDVIRREWDALRQHDVLFLVNIRAHAGSAHPFNASHGLSFREHYGITCVRGCEVLALLDANGKPIEEHMRARGQDVGALVGKSGLRTLRVLLDTNQYRDDIDAVNQGGPDMYDSFNVLVRRRPRENNFKAVLETIRGLMLTRSASLPPWLTDIFLGYGDPSSAHYASLLKAAASPAAAVDLRDTFLDAAHVVASFPSADVVFERAERSEPPYRLTFDAAAAAGQRERVRVEAYAPPLSGPLPSDAVKRNAVRFTPTQVEAIRAGAHRGLTLVVGPPGTGKTDVAVQIIANIYHSHPRQRTLIITHSNQALNQIFDKIVELDVDERHCIRLGHGEEQLESTRDFSKNGRVNYFLAKRLELLAQVNALAASLAIPGDYGYTCETAGYFFNYHVTAAWEKFHAALAAAGEEGKTAAAVVRLFPFSAYFASALQVPLFPEAASYEQAKEIADGCMAHVRNIFQQLEEMRPMELLRQNSDRANYLLTKEARIVAMTCTHAALKRQELVSLGFKYDNVIMEEAAQILEIESFIPLMLQDATDGVARLERVVLIGDHNQLPPVVKNSAFGRYGNMEQSLFARLVRLGVPTIDLDAQGRARDSLCALYSWRYRKLGSLPLVLAQPEFQRANAGFAYDYQFVNVDDLNGKGETEPMPHFYQNLAEAEYVVAVFMYMRLIGYPADKIAILTSYNGQKDLIRDVVGQRCAWNPLFGRPAAISTVDKFQGRQADYVLLSLVRTKAVGHMRDVRRLIVAMSRARLGLYVFGRRALFEGCYELAPAMSQLAARPPTLQLQMGEVFPTTRSADDAGTPTEMADLTAMGAFVHQMMEEQMKRVVKHQQELQQQADKEDKADAMDTA